MRRARITFNGAFHHVMNRGHNGEPIFRTYRNKQKFLQLLKKYSFDYRIRILAYCIMENHYHLILENSSGKMSVFFKSLNGQFGRIYRQRTGGKGYVFQDRYKSMIIQDEAYLLMAIAYVLNNPVKKAICSDFTQYKWSSASIYFADEKSSLVDLEFIEEVFGTKDNLLNLVPSLDCDELPTVKTRLGTIIGGQEFVVPALEKFDRRQERQSHERKRIDDKHFEPVEKIISEFEKKYKIKLEKIDTTTHFGKRLRGFLLVNLKEKAGLTFQEIIKFDIFGDLQLHSLGSIYKNSKLRLRENR